MSERTIRARGSATWCYWWSPPPGWWSRAGIRWSPCSTAPGPGTWWLPGALLRTTGAQRRLLVDRVEGDGRPPLAAGAPGSPPGPAGQVGPGGACGTPPAGPPCWLGRDTVAAVTSVAGLEMALSPVVVFVMGTGLLAVGAAAGGDLVARPGAGTGGGCAAQAAGEPGARLDRPKASGRAGEAAARRLCGVAGLDRGLLDLCRSPSWPTWAPSLTSTRPPSGGGRRLHGGLGCWFLATIAPQGPRCLR